ncbi:mitochondrial protein Pet127-domain-containing protein [Mycena amicta]|nr:mitochondrial protein Pet127-domain-containing protein [Mycena amicta]
MRRVGLRLFSTTLARNDPALKKTLSDRLKTSSQPLIAASKLALIHTREESTEVLNALAASSKEPLPVWQPQDEWGPDTLVPTDINKREPPPHKDGKGPLKWPGTKKSAAPRTKSPRPSNDARAPPSTVFRRTEGLIDPTDQPVLRDCKPNSIQRPIATLAHGLERVLFNPGVHWLQDPRSRVYNFPPYLEHIPRVNDFAFEKLAGFVKSSRDEDLRSLAKREDRLFAGSTSSLSGMLSHCYFLISEHRPVDISSLSHVFANEDKNFTPGQRMPTSVTFNYKDGVYAIDSDSDDTSKNVLTWLGTLLEKFLTTPEAEFKEFMRSSSTQSAPEAEEDPVREAYRYSKSEKFVMRSQLDCVDRRLPGTGVFDIKTRACLPVRMDILNWEENSGYVLKFAQGLYESFEREYYDLIRSAFLKYAFQVRIGNMDGVIVAYHNTARTFGFQYISLEEMDRCLFGTEPNAGERIFHKCVTLLESIATEIVQCFPEQSVKCTFECEQDERELNVWVQPTEWVETENQPEPPMHQLVIRAQSFLADTPVSASRAINSSPEHPWTLHWSLSHLSQDQEEIRQAYAQCMDRKFRAWSIPTGVSFEDLPQFWSELNFGAPKTETAESGTEDSDSPPDIPADFDPARFRKPDFRVQVLRDLARSGRQFSEVMDRMDARRKKIVLGEAFDPEDIEPGEELEDATPSDLVEQGESQPLDLELLKRRMNRSHSPRKRGMLRLLKHVSDARKRPPP